MGTFLGKKEFFKAVENFFLFGYTYIQTHKHTNTQTHKHTNTQTHKYTNTQTHKHTNTQTHKHAYTRIHTHTYIGTVEDCTHILHIGHSCKFKTNLKKFSL